MTSRAYQHGVLEILLDCFCVDYDHVFVQGDVVIAASALERLFSWTVESNRQLHGSPSSEPSCFFSEHD
jgi:hypothetical protein